MTFLELCNRVRQESGISGSGPITVFDQQAILAKVVEWVRQADLDIQRLQPDWTFLWRTGSATLAADVRQYSMFDLGLQDISSLINLSIDGSVLKELDWYTFKEWAYHRHDDTGQPTCYTFRPDGVMLVFPIPDFAYSVDAEYRAMPVALQDDLDTSVIPERFHDVIMHKALTYYASHEEDGNLLQSSTMRYENSLAELAAACLPKMEFKRGVFI